MTPSFTCGNPASCSRVLPLKRPAPRNVRLAAAVNVPSTFSKVSPKGDYCFVKSAPEETQTTGGILLPAAAQRKPTTGTVQSIGDGRVGPKTHNFTVNPGDTVLYSKFGFTYTELKVQGMDYLLIRENDVIGTLPKADASADDIPDLAPLHDRVLVKIDESSEVTAGGVAIPDSAKEKPLSGTVVRVGSGKQNDDGSVEPCQLRPGERILYFKYAGDNMQTTTGDKYVVLHESDVLSRA